MISHDRKFVNAVADRVWVVRDGRVTDWRGNYDDYLASQGLA